MRHVYFECQCESDEHRLVFTLEDEEFPNFEDWWEPELYVSAYLKDWEPWYKRLWKGLKYIVGRKTKFGHFDTMLVKREDVDTFIEMMETFKTRYDKYWEGKRNHLKNG